MLPLTGVDFEPPFANYNLRVSRANFEGESLSECGLRFFDCLTTNSRCAIVIFE